MSSFTELGSHPHCPGHINRRYHSKDHRDLVIYLWEKRIRLHLGDYPPWFLTLSHQGICCLNSVQDLQNYDLYKCLSPSSSSKLMLQNDYLLWIFSKAISRRVIKIPAYNGGVLNRHRPRTAGYLSSGFTCQQIRYLNL